MPCRDGGLQRFAGGLFGLRKSLWQLLADPMMGPLPGRTTVVARVLVMRWPIETGEIR